jgi:DNA polymerase III delta prime subunit
MGRRKFTGSPLSLFSFQDIVTSVTGIFVLITLLIAVELSQRVLKQKSQPPPQRSESYDEEIQAELERIAKLEQLQGAPSEEVPEFATYTTQSAEQARSDLKAEIARLQVAVSQSAAEAESAEDSAAAASAQSEARSSERIELEQVESLLAALEQELTELENSQRVFYNVPDSKGRRVLLVELFAEEILLAPAGVERPPLRASGLNRVDTIMAAIRRNSTDSVRVVMIVHPGAVDVFRELYDEVKSRGYSRGFDVLPDSSLAIDPEKGAG